MMSSQEEVKWLFFVRESFLGSCLSPQNKPFSLSRHPGPGAVRSLQFSPRNSARNFQNHFTAGVSYIILLETKNLKNKRLNIVSLIEQWQPRAGMVAP